MITPSRTLVEKYAKPGPRYTSYPTAPNWSSQYSAADYRRTLAELKPGPAGVSLYIHIPFCERRCTFCACNVIVSRDHRQGTAYVDLLTREMDATLAAAGGLRPAVTQLHWGGGTPTWLASSELVLLFDRIAERFRLLSDREQSIEVHPVVTTLEQVDVLRSRGLNRLSLGIQDFDPVVQARVHRDQTYAETERLIRHARQTGIAGINADLIYGLPSQTSAGFDRTLAQVIALGVDRVALYNFAYLPETIPLQKAIDPHLLPDLDTRLNLFMLALERFAAAGYRQIGLDHFAKPGDELNEALEKGTLQRNFMGYTTRAGRDLLAFGTSAISRVGRDYAQSHKELDAYRKDLETNQLPVARGWRLSADDLLREEIIQRIMCYGQVDVSNLSRAHGQKNLADDTGVQDRLAPLIQDQLATWQGGRLAVTGLGRFFLRNIAMVFDAYLPAAPGSIPAGVKPTHFSQTV